MKPDEQQTENFAKCVATVTDLQRELTASRALVVRLRDALEELADLMDSVRDSLYVPDSFTTQPARVALAAAAEHLKGVGK